LPTRVEAVLAAVALNVVDLDTTLTVWAQAAYDTLLRRLSGYESAAPDTIWRRSSPPPATSPSAPTRSSSASGAAPTAPVLRSAAHPVVQVPWWGGRRRTRLGFACS
jgi:hypothetical protein